MISSFVRTFELIRFVTANDDGTTSCLVWFKMGLITETRWINRCKQIMFKNDLHLFELINNLHFDGTMSRSL